MWQVETPGDLYGKLPRAIRGEPHVTARVHGGTCRRGVVGDCGARAAERLPRGRGD
jgi:hypothetical protein